MRLQTGKLGQPRPDDDTDPDQNSSAPAQKLASQTASDRTWVSAPAGGALLRRDQLRFSKEGGPATVKQCAQGGHHSGGSAGQSIPQTGFAGRENPAVAHRTLADGQGSPGGLQPVEHPVRPYQSVGGHTRIASADDRRRRRGPQQSGFSQE